MVPGKVCCLQQEEARTEVEESRGATEAHPELRVSRCRASETRRVSRPAFRPQEEQSRGSLGDAKSTCTSTRRRSAASDRDPSTNARHTLEHHFSLNRFPDGTDETHSDISTQPRHTHTAERGAESQTRVWQETEVRTQSGVEPAAERGPMTGRPPDFLLLLFVVE